MKRPPDTHSASQGKRIAYEIAIASFFAARKFRSRAPPVLENQRLQMGVLNGALPIVLARRAAASVLIHRVI
jgi:hypothetical protein